MVIGNHRKSCCCFQQITMSNGPVDKVPSMMEEDFGTKVLITDPKSDAILARSSRYGTERYSRWCGGKGGFDDWCERVH